MWRHLADFPALPASEVTAVTGTADGFLAVGFQPAEGEDFFGIRQGVVWRSADGLEWQRIIEPAFANATLLEVVALEDAVFVFGLLSICRQLEEDCTDLPESGITVWRSAAGGMWQRLPQSPTMRDALLDGVLAGRDQIIAFGSSGEDLAATIWLSTDGLAWEDVTELAGMDPLSAVAAGPEGYVAFGTRYLPETDTLETVAAVSADGRSFEPATLPAGLDAVIESVVHGPNGWVAVGYDDEPAGLGLSAAALHSADGRQWQPAQTHESFSGAGFHHVESTGEGYVAVGFLPAGLEGEREEARSWRSPDGLAWEPFGPLAGAAYRQFNGAGMGSPGLAVFAVDYEDATDEEASSTVTAWFAPAEALRGR